MFGKILNWIKEVISKLINKDVTKQLGVDIAVSTAMSNAIELWSDMYKGRITSYNVCYTKLLRYTCSNHYIMYYRF